MAAFLGAINVLVWWHSLCFARATILNHLFRARITPTQATTHWINTTPAKRPHESWSTTLRRSGPHSGEYLMSPKTFLKPTILIVYNRQLKFLIFLINLDRHCSPDVTWYFDLSVSAQWFYFSFVHFVLVFTESLSEPRSVWNVALPVFFHSFKSLSRAVHEFLRI